MQGLGGKGGDGGKRSTPFWKLLGSFEKASSPSFLYQVVLKDSNHSENKVTIPNLGGRVLIRM